MLSRVKIQNFKSIGKPGVDLELKPLTFLVGPNGGGKSSIIEGIGVTAKRHSGRQLINFDRLHRMLHRSEGKIREPEEEVEATIELDFVAVNAPNTHVGVKYSAVAENVEWVVDAEERTEHERAFTGLRGLWADHRQQTFLLSATRGDLPFETGAGPQVTWVGPRGEGLLSALAQALGPGGDDEVAGRIIRWAERFGLGGLKAGIAGSDLIGASSLDQVSRVRVDSALGSGGARQILTVITQLFWAPRGSLLMIEEPEISLHPKAQLDVMEMFAEAINEENKQIIATTHSLLMMQAIGYAVHKSWLNTEQIAVYHVEKDEGGTKAELLPLDENGYIEGWIPSFTEVERKLLLEWAETLPRGR